MKQNAGYAVLVAVAIAAVRLASGGSDAPPSAEIARKLFATPEKIPVNSSAAGTYKGGCTAFLADHEGGQGLKDPNRGSAKAVLDSFFRLDSAKETGPQLIARAGVRYVVTLVPDPRHTNLSLMFDRAMVMTQQAAQDEGYSYNSAWLPWSAESSKFPLRADQLAADDDASHGEACPGILLFRKSVSFPPATPGVEPYNEGVVVLVVGEQPTGGVNEDQWANAIHWLNENASAQEKDTATASAEENVGLRPRSLRILGPSFSGSLVSLQRNLEDIYKPVEGLIGPHPFPNGQTATVVLSGGVSSCSLVRWFGKRIEQTPINRRATFGTFNENDELHITRFLDYLGNQGTHISDAAILSEDETAYGNPQVKAKGVSQKDQSERPPEVEDDDPSCEVPYEHGDRPVRLSYPRDISALRAAYEKQSVFGVSGSSSRTSRSILQDSSGLEGDGPSPSDTIRAYSGPLSPVAQEAVLYGIVSVLRGHHTRYLILRCTNPLDNLFLTRFFHRAYPEARIVTVASDLLFRREIDTTEFRGVLALSSYSLLPRNQHWAHLSEEGASPPPLPHTHRTFEYNIEGIYLAGRYLFDFSQPPGTTEPLGVERSTGKPISLPFKENLPDYADPFWMHSTEEPLTGIHPPTWLAAVGRDGYWPIAVLNGEITPKLLIKPDDSYLPAGNSPSTMVRLRATANRKPHYDLNPGEPVQFDKALLFSLPFPWQVCVFCAFLLLLYQLFAIMWGKDWTSSGLFAPFRPVSTPSQAILLGINSAFAFFLPIELFLIGFTPSAFGDVFGGTQVLGIAAMLVPIMGLISLYLRDVKNTGIAAASFILSLGALATASHFAIGLNLNGANAVPFFYRMGHLTSGVSPFVPILFLLGGFYLWTWQAMAGNSLLCCGRPMLPRLRGEECFVRKNTLQHWYYTLIGLSTEASSTQYLLGELQHRISNVMERRIVRIASPLCFDSKVVVFPAIFAVAAVIFFHGNLPLLGLESRSFAFFINFALLTAFLVTTAEALRLYYTWNELRRLLAALNRLRLRRTFAKLRAVDANSLWSVSGNVQRIQVHFFSQQLDAATRLSRLPSGDRQSVLKALASGWQFAATSASRIDSGARWEQSVSRLASLSGFSMGMGRGAGNTVAVMVREDLNNAVADVLNCILLPLWDTETTSLSLENTSAKSDDKGRNIFDMKLSKNLLVGTAEEFVCFHYIAFIQNILARMRTMILSMIFLFVAVCFAISFYPFVPRTQIGLWMMLNLLLIGSSVIYVYAAMERDETLSYIANTPPGRLSPEFWIKTAGFLAGPVIGLLTTQFPSIAESVLGWLQPGLDAIK